MSEKIEIGLRKRDKFTNAFAVTILGIFYIICIYKILTKDFETVELVFFVVYTLIIIYLIITFHYFFPNQATKITIEDSFVTVKLHFNKTFVIPLTSITNIEIFGYEPANRHFFVISYDDNKNFNTLPLCYRYDRSVDFFISKLRHSLAKAKEEQKK